jgi:hypothetical protein
MADRSAIEWTTVLRTSRRPRKPFRGGFLITVRDHAEGLRVWPRCVGPGSSPEDFRAHSDPVERLRVAERAAQRWPVAGQGADLEVGLPFGNRRLDGVLAAEDKTEPSVIGRVAEQGGQRLADCVSGTENGVHEGAADAAALMVRVDAQRPEGEHGRLADMAASAYDVSDDLAARAGCDQRQGRQPCRAGSQIVNERGLGWCHAGLAGAGECRGGDGADAADIGGSLAADQHGLTIGCPRPVRQLDSCREGGQ